MDEKAFEKLGLTKGEIKVYLALNRFGESTIGPIGAESKVSKSKLYDILDKLIAKGLVGYIIKNNVKYFSANDPKMLITYLNKKDEELHKIKQDITKLLPELSMKRKAKKRTAEIYEGFEGLKAIREELMLTFSKGDELLVLGAPKVANDKWEAWLLDFHKRRIAGNVSMKIIYNSNAREYGKVRTKMKITRVKYLPSSLVSPNWIDVFNDAIMMGIVSEQKVLAIVIRDESLVKSFKEYFELMWDISKP
jgi:sugar-specific transcriptional regulator TrmB